MNARLRLSFLALAAILVCIVPRLEAAPLGSGFTYQGQIQKNAQPYTGTAQLLMRLYDAEAAGAQIGPDASLPTVSVSNGLFTVELDFGAAPFSGDARWLEIRVKTTGDADYTLLTPRQKITAAPYSIFSASGAGGGDYWVNAGNGHLRYSGGNVGVTGGGTPITSGRGVFIEGASTNGYLWAHDYDINQPLPLLVNPFGGRVSVGSFSPPDGQLTSVSSSVPAIVGRHTSNWVGVYGESQSYQGVFGKSLIGTGVAGEGGGAYNAGVAGFSTNASGWGGYFKNNAGGVALYADGKAAVRTLDIIGGADIVEGFETGTQSLEPGTVVVIDESHPGELRASRVAYDHHVAGVVSGAGGIAPGLKLGQEGALDGETLVAMSGRVYVRCSAENSPIRPGDLLTTAGKAGHAMRASDAGRSHGAVLGKAMTSLDRGAGLVLVLVNLQ